MVQKLFLFFVLMLVITACNTNGLLGKSQTVVTGDPNTHSPQNPADSECTWKVFKLDYETHQPGIQFSPNFREIFHSVRTPDARTNEFSLIQQEDLKLPELREVMVKSTETGRIAELECSVGVKWYSPGGEGPQGNFVNCVLKDSEAKVHEKFLLDSFVITHRDFSLEFGAYWSDEGCKETDIAEYVKFGENGFFKYILKQKENG